MGSGAAVESPCAGAAAGMARAPRRTTSGLPMKGILQNGCELAGEAGHDVFAIERLLEGHDLIDAVGAVDPDQAAKTSCPASPASSQPFCRIPFMGRPFVVL